MTSDELAINLLNDRMCSNCAHRGAGDTPDGHFSVDICRLSDDILPNDKTCKEWEFSNTWHIYYKLPTSIETIELKFNTNKEDL